MRVMIADENTIQRKKLRQVIETRGYKVVEEAHNGLLAYQKFIETKPDLLILNMRMPIHDGLSTMKRIFDQEQANIVVMTHQKDNKMIFDALESGALHYLRLPLHEKNIIKTLDEVVSIIENRRKNV